jgi:hypothetical protein
MDPARIPTLPGKKRDFKIQCSKCLEYTKDISTHRVQHAAECDGTHSGRAFRRPPNSIAKLEQKSRNKRGRFQGQRRPTRASAPQGSQLAVRVHGAAAAQGVHSDLGEEDTNRLLGQLAAGHVRAVGHPPRQGAILNRLEELSVSAPRAMSELMYKNVVRAVCKSENICTLILLGGSLASTNTAVYSRALAFLARAVATSHVLHLNVGEYPGADHAPLLAALKDRRCIVGYLFAELDTYPGLKEQMRLALKVNRGKAAHKIQFARLFDVAQFGAHTWWMPSPYTLNKHRETALNLAFTPGMLNTPGLLRAVQSLNTTGLLRAVQRLTWATWDNDTRRGVLNRGSFDVVEMIALKVNVRPPPTPYWFNLRVDSACISHVGFACIMLERLLAYTRDTIACISDTSRAQGGSSAQVQGAVRVLGILAYTMLTKLSVANKITRSSAHVRTVVSARAVLFMPRGRRRLQ